MDISKNEYPPQNAENRLADLEFEITMLDNPEFSDGLHDYLEEAGFLVKSTDNVCPDWGNTAGREALEELSLPQVDELVRVAHKDLASRIAQDVEKGMSVEDAYMSRAATDPAATLIAEATVVRNEKQSNYQKEIEQLRERANLTKGFDKNFSAEIEKQAIPNREKIGLEQVKYWVKDAIDKSVNNGADIAKEALTQLKEGKIDWQNPEFAAGKIVQRIDELEFGKDKDERKIAPEFETVEKASVAKVQSDELLLGRSIYNGLTAEVTTEEMRKMSTQEFTALAAAAYVDKYTELTGQGKDSGVASTVAVAKIKDMAKKANLKISLRDISDSQLQKASENPKEVAKLLENRIKPTRLASLNKDKSRSNENER